MKKIVSLTNVEVATGLRLGGLKECYVVDPAKVEEQLLDLSARGEIGILIVDDDVARKNHELIAEIRARKEVFPIIVEVQTRTATGPLEGEDPLKDLIKRAIGVDISADKEGSIPKF